MQIVKLLLSVHASIVLLTLFGFVSLTKNNLLALATYGASQVPKLILFEAGKAIYTEKGLHSNSRIREIIRNHIN